MKIIIRVILILWLIIIFMFSNQASDKSNTTSDHVTETITSTITTITKEGKITKEKQKEININTRVIVRKTAHFLAFLILGIITFMVLKDINKLTIKYLILISISFCFIYACSDEIHQLFISGRTAQVLDILIDTIGASFGVLIMYLLKKKELKRS